MEGIKPPFDGYSVCDLTHKFEETIPAFPGHAKYQHCLWESPDFGSFAYGYTLILSEHIGTHVDALAHFVTGNKKWIDEMPVESFMGPCCNINAQNIGPRESLDKEHVKRWEAKYGSIVRGDIVLVNFGWYKRWGTGTRGLNYLKDWPGISERASTYLADLKVKLVGVDPVSTDPFCNFSEDLNDYQAHSIFLSRGVPLVEGLTNLDSVPPKGAFFLGLPLKIKGGSGSPIRAIAFIPKEPGRKS